MKSNDQNFRSGEYFEDDYHTLIVRDGILFGTYKQRIKKIDLDLAKKLVHDRKLVTNGKIYPVCIDLYRAVAIEKDARVYFSSQEAMEGLAAVGVLVRNQITKHGATIWNLIDKPSLPTKVFTDRAKAIEWLRQFQFLN